ncbi:MAG TPA: hypothetical protein K8V35_03660 [Aliicoccus persicus]|uniref:Uncharacterized protein n=1 Tax=Aliicoccus persicus TaxID=930138 RepID=A0A921B6L0_9STAP|nr:hypothetical protein [Aliicoccus persicus]
MKVIQNFKRETRNFIIIALIAVIVLNLFLVYFAETDMQQVLYALSSSVFGIVLGMFIAAPRFKLSKEEETDTKDKKKTSKDQSKL